MPRVERKSKINIDIKVVGADGGAKGRLYLTSGNLYYYRPNAKNESGRYTYLQLIELIERDMEQG